MSIHSDVEIGTEFVGYRVEGLIGRGGMGLVYRAYDLRLKRRVALKFVAPELALDERFRSRFLRESELAASLDHPNVVPIYDAGEANGRLYLAMRYVEGTDLRALLHDSGALEPSRALAVCRQVANALDAAHASGLVHRDVKPSNVLLDDHEHVYLADFGLTRRLADESRPQLDGRSVGTPAYLAPEQIEGAPPDARADVYSLGCLLFECLTGEPPFPHDSRLALAWAHLEEEPPSASARNAALPSALDGVLRRALAKDPTERPPSCTALITAAETALGLRTPDRTRRRTALIAIAAALLAALAVVAAALALRSDEGAADPALFGRPNTVVRIDPETNAVADVIEVGTGPAAVAVHGSRVWVYNYDDDTVATFDAATPRHGRRTTVRARPLDLSAYTGPVLAADAGGAWLIGTDDADRTVLTRVRAAGGAPTVRRLDGEPRAVATGFGAVWVAVRRGRDSELVRIDTATGKTRRLSFPEAAPIDSLAAGLGHVWAVSASGRTLYRVKPRARAPTVDRYLGGVRRPRPFLARSLVWAGLSVREPTTLDEVRSLSCCSPARGESIGGFGSVWTFDTPSGTVVRWGDDWEIEQTIGVVATPPALGGPCVSSIATGPDAVWVTVAPSFDVEEPCAP